MEAYRCDMCGQLFEYEEMPPLITIYGDDEFYPFKDYDVCRSCYKSVTHLVRSIEDGKAHEHL